MTKIIVKMKKYLLGTSKDFYEFINSIDKNKDRVGIITHTDLDGLASGVFLHKILESKGIKPIFTKFLDYGSDALKGVGEGVNILIFSDWNADNFLEDFENLRKDKKVLVIDHHPLNEHLKDKSNVIKTPSKYCSAHALFDLSKEGGYFDTKDAEWLVCGAIIFDYCFDDEENFNFLKSVYPTLIKEDIWNSQPALISKKIANALIYYKPNVDRVYDMILNKDFESLDNADKIISEEYSLWKDKFKNEAEYYPNSELYFYYANPKYGITSAVVSAVSQQEVPNKILVFVSDDPNREGFVKLSARNQTGEVKLGDILRKCVEGFEDASAGGHDKASAGSFPKEYLNEFKARIIEELSKK
jgi:single-stranded DNA-specific DHH superfamily exonuclease